MSEVKCSDLLVSKADLEELNSQWAQKNIDLSSEIELLKVICLYYANFVALFKVWTVPVTVVCFVHLSLILP